MSIEEIRNFCLGLPYTEETMPFDDTTIVYKVGGKWFAVTDLNENNKVVVKCDPDIAIELRDRHEEITPAWHFNKKYWNQHIIPALDDSLIMELIDHSYDEVVKKFSRQKREELHAITAEL